MNFQSIILFGLLFPLSSWAQHCRWDGSQIIVFEIKTSPADTQSIDGLMVDVVDSVGEPYFNSCYCNGIENRVKVSVFHNQIGTQCNPLNVDCTKNVDFWFAKNNYLLVGTIDYFQKIGIQLVIEDTLKSRIGGLFESKTISLDPNYAFPLCHSFSSWESKREPQFVEDFKPLTVIMKFRNNP
jgi:hypothetical protein